MDLNQIIAFIKNNKGKTAGIAVGLVFGWFAICYGVFKAIFVFICIAAGYYIGCHIDRRGNIKDIFSFHFKDK